MLMHEYHTWARGGGETFLLSWWWGVGSWELGGWGLRISLQKWGEGVVRGESYQNRQFCHLKAQSPQSSFCTLWTELLTYVHTFCHHAATSM